MSESEELKERIGQTVDKMQSHLRSIKTLGAEIGSQELLTKLKQYERELQFMQWNIHDEFERQAKPRRV